MSLNLFSEFFHALPEISLCLFAMLVLMLGAFQKRSKLKGVYYVTIVGIIAAIVILYFSIGTYAYAFNDMFKINPFSQIMKSILLVTVLSVFFMTFKHFPREQMHRFEYPALIMISTVGMMLMISANDLISAFLGLEMQSLPLYIMVSIARDRPASNEAGMKYFVLGALATAFFLFGSSYLYGFTGTTEFNGIMTVIQTTPDLPFPIAVAFLMILIALAFKVSLVPFHMWAPDIFEGAPTPVTSFIATAPKIAAFVLLLNFVSIFSEHNTFWLPIFSVIAIASILLGSFAALFQKKLKRLLAYSSISHMGFAFLGFLSLKSQGFINIFNYLIIYMIMTVGVFAVLLTLRKRGQLLENIEDLTGLSKDAPLIALCMTILLFSLAGIPPFAGFFAKVAVIQNAISGDYYLAAIIAVLGSVVSAAYYLRVIKAMYFDQPVGGTHTLTIDKAIPKQTKLVLIISTALVTLYILAPNLFTLDIGRYIR